METEKKKELFEKLLHSNIPNKNQLIQETFNRVVDVADGYSKIIDEFLKNRNEAK